MARRALWYIRLTFMSQHRNTYYPIPRR
ncbi:hypothetical protein M199_gp065 [Halogranum tailed virus 1]|uniref:Uncharacterized protein n=1 Tax=Halogranum tailed virus 1 TaxID=1273749 RepID=R4TH37_9CAUD|nr:hypothetical protein M199_gp065 [Halogranum tailed virus 1]AGM11601.1 hypothetical protein HGTV1_304 [Halogranum tailed virus 1]